MLAPPLQRLVTELSKLPGIGNRTAQRLAFHVLRASNEDALALAQAIQDVKEKITLCEVCFNLAEGPRCTICLDERRDMALICVVEEPGDVIPIERTHEFRGRYHVLGGALSPIDGVEPEDLRLGQLYARMDGIREVVLATNPTTTGEATALHIAAALHERAPDVAVTRLASGLPVGGDLEYADEVTLGRAFAGRRSRMLRVRGDAALESALGARHARPGARPRALAAPVRGDAQRAVRARGVAQRRDHPSRGGLLRRERPELLGRRQVRAVQAVRGALLADGTLRGPQRLALAHAHRIQLLQRRRRAHPVRGVGRRLERLSRPRP